MGISSLTYGGRNAWAYKKLTRVINVQNKVLSLFASEDSSLLVKLSRIDEKQTSMIIDGEFIDLTEVKYLVKKIKRLGEKKALRLLLQYGTIDNIKKANIIELKKIEGIGDKLARLILTDL